MVIDVLRKSFKLKDFLEVLELSKSSYFYQRNGQARADKYAQVKEQIIETFNQSYRCYGYRRIWYSLRRVGTRISEKVVRKLMQQEGLHVYYLSSDTVIDPQNELTPTNATH